MTRIFAWSIVSTPSASGAAPRALDSSMAMRHTDDENPSDQESRSTRDLSSLTVSALVSPRRERDDVPVPKSSMAMRKPREDS